MNEDQFKRLQVAILTEVSRSNAKVATALSDFDGRLSRVEKDLKEAQRTKKKLVKHVLEIKFELQDLSGGVLDLTESILSVLDEQVSNPDERAA